MKALSVLLFMFLILAVPARSIAGDEGFKFGKDPEIEQVRPKKPVKIKLRRLSDGNYTWEITGDDTAEIIKADKQLRKFLGKSQ